MCVCVCVCLCVFVFINWSRCTKLVLSASLGHGLIAQSSRVSGWNSVVVGSSPTQVNFL